MVTEVETETGNGIVESLLQPAAYREKTLAVELRETHISWVFLTDRHAYKLKKPVRFEFLDFSTLEARRRACLDEVELNRRWSRGVYLGVIPLVRSPGGDVVMGPADGQILDWVVKMRRLDDRLRLDQRIVAGRLSDDERRRVVRALVETYTRLPPLPVRADEFRARVESHVKANWEELARVGDGLSHLQVERSQGGQWRWLRLFGQWLEDRARNGRVIDGHGDLRPDHIYLEDPPAIIDCVEFSADLRRVDTLDDLAFLAMDCQVIGELQLGENLVEQYRRVAGDEFPRRLFWFYVAYRASVRAKVHSLRAEQNGGRVDREAQQQAARYLQAADEAAAKLLPPLIVVMRGVSGSGKSTLARELSEELALVRIATDELRRELYGAAASAHQWEAGYYTSEARQRVYERMFELASARLEAGLSLLLDATFLARTQCERMSELAERFGAEVIFVECRCPVHRLRERLAARRPGDDTASEATWDVARRQLGLFEPLHDVSQVVVDTTASFPQQIERVKTGLKQIANRQDRAG